MSAENSAKLVEHYQNQLKKLRIHLPKNILLLDLAIITKEPAKVDVNFFSLNGANSEDSDKLLKTFNKIIKSQIANTPIGDIKEFFNYDAQ